MRAFKVDPQQISQQEIHYSGDKLHHLINVVRVKQNEEIVLYSCDGSHRKYKAIEVGKKSLILLAASELTHQKPQHYIDCCVGITKKDAFEDCIRMSVELGVTKLIPVKMKNSHFDFQMYDRIDKIVQSAQEQSNNFNSFEIQPQIDFIDNDLLKNYDHIFVFTSEFPTSIELENKMTNVNKLLCIIGPEGGFHPDELNHLKQNSKVSFIRLKTPILRTTTALPTAIGHILSKTD
jgi:16S rRNA (uracil1498-N3)-methyltransferase